MNNDLEIETIAVVAKFNDGKIRQLVVNQKTLDLVLQVLQFEEGRVRVLETPIDTIDILNNES